MIEARFLEKSELYFLAEPGRPKTSVIQKLEKSQNARSKG